MRSTQPSDPVSTSTPLDQPTDLMSAESGFAVDSASADETQHLGELVGRLLRPGDLLLLQGRIGAGKTTFTQGIARGMGIHGRVTSPSFTLANVYDVTARGFPLYHLDLWRIGSPLEALGIGLDEYLEGAGACVVEWPDIAESVLPDQHVRIGFALVAERRRLTFRADGKDRPHALMRQIHSALGAEGRSFASGD